MSRRPGGIKRHAGIRQAPSILVCVEGEATEYEYAKALREHFEIPTARLYIPKPSKRTDVVSLIGEAKKLMGRGSAYRKRAGAGKRKRGEYDERFVDNDFDEAWVVFDTEGDERELEKAEKAVSGIRDKEVRRRFRLCPSRPCFELWLILHFLYSTRRYTDSKECENAFDRIAESAGCSGYLDCGKHVDRRLRYQLMGKLEQAEKNAARLRAACEPRESGIGTDCDGLVRAVAGLVSKRSGT